ncbi:MAG TPA: pseudouridine-5'-phosphate glycosidase, partial [Devosiaceae bacterium]|nr:pseudouridine-5'-phosphate glycosidase [Devosiaceae bacterium]
MNKMVDIAEEVADALAEGRAVVALESTIITHGMDHPDNLQIALECEAAIRARGAVPATIAIIDGRLVAG